MQKNTLEGPQPWWKFGYVWLVVAGPAIVVVAAIFTFYLAVTRPDQLVSEDYYRQGIEINKTLGDAQAASRAPALQARNHAQTGVLPSGQTQGKP